MGPDLLLDAAHRLLEKLPPAKVTRAEVAREAGVDPSLIRYYFRDRTSLLHAVVARLMKQWAEQRDNDAEGGSAAERLRARVRSVFQFIATQPYVHKLLVQEIAVSTSSRARQTFHSVNHSAIDRYAKILRDGAKDGTLRKMDPVLLHIAVIGMSEFFFESRPLLDDAFGKGAVPAAYVKRYGDFVADLVVEGLRRH